MQTYQTHPNAINFASNWSMEISSHNFTNLSQCIFFVDGVDLRSDHDDPIFLKLHGRITHHQQAPLQPINGARLDGDRTREELERIDWEVGHLPQRGQWRSRGRQRLSQRGNAGRGNEQKGQLRNLSVLKRNGRRIGKPGINVNHLILQIDGAMILSPRLDTRSGNIPLA
jgi:hypothetical protein